MITRENLITLLQASGRDIAQCEGSCAVDTARLIGADYVVAGDFSRVGPSVKLTLTLYDSKIGNVLAGTTAAGRNPAGLDESAQLVAGDLFTPLLAECAAGQVCLAFGGLSQGICSAPGTLSEGQACSQQPGGSPFVFAPALCVAGLQCVSDSGGASHCHVICDGSHPCAAGTCQNGTCR